MVVTNEKCHICGRTTDFVIDDKAVLLREAKCSYCGASIRNSDVAGEILNFIQMPNADLMSVEQGLVGMRILNACSSGYIHDALKGVSGYTCCEYLDEIPSGEYQDGVLCVDLCDIPFPADTFDIVITEDVFEHIVDYETAMKEILRVLKVGGCHIFTVPVHENKKTERREGKLPVYHDDPVRPEDGTLVVTDWGEDIKDVVEKFGYSVEVKNMHPFYAKEEITDIDKDYEGYLKQAKQLEQYLKYNSIVIAAAKRNEAKNTKMAYIQPKSVEIVELNRVIREKNDLIFGLKNDNEMRGKHIVRLDQDLEAAGKRIVELQDEDGRKTQHIHKLDGELEAASKYITELQIESEKRNQHIRELNGELEAASKHIVELRDEDEKKNRHIRKLDGELEAFRKRIVELQDKDERKSRHIAVLDGGLEAAGRRIVELQEDDERKNLHIQKLDGELEVAGKRIFELQDEDERKSQHIAELDGGLEAAGRRIVELQEDDERKNLHIQKLDGELEAAGKRIFELQDEDEEKSRHIVELAEKLDIAGKRFIELQDEDKRKNRHILELDIQIDELRQQEDDLIQENNELRYQIEQINQQNNELTRKNGESNQQIEMQNQQIADLQQTVRNKEGHVELLLKVERQYEHEKTTHAYKFGKRVQKVGNWVLPLNSRRRFFARIIFNVFRHPRLMVNVINPKRVKNYLKYIRLEGMDGVKSRYEEAVDIERMQMDPASRLDLELEHVTQSSLAAEEKMVVEYETIELPYCDRPVVSIVIPVYNQFHYTYNCLKSILKNTGDVAYEVLVADDCSTDVTRDVEKIAKNVRLITTEKNVRFLLNCNFAAQFAKGKYILFLNNDTQVQSNWLEPLINLIERDEKIGMVGSKLVYPDGYLQEAGGIVWKDASAWNYGHRKSPEDPEYNYVKEADYISGAAIMIRKTLWEEIGGFDERFAPAYYEDTDLAFEVRKRNYKVMYQPLSVVVHFEGVSNGTDIEDGLKQYQQVNFQKFYDKWKDVLEKEHEPNGINVFTAKDRSNHKKHILVVDHYVPHHDQDAGGKCTYMYLKLFVKMGLQVTFIGDNFYKHEPYTTELNQMGIEVLCGNFYYNNWQQWLKENSHYFEYIYLQRPHISVKYIDLVKLHSEAKIFYFAHDLHHVREYREYEMTGDTKKLESSKHWKEIEYDLFDKADVGHVVGSYEQGVMQEVFPSKPIRNIPLYIYDSILNDINKDFKTRHDLLYVGGFGHPPNVDAVLWFAKEVYPAVLERHPEMKWHVVGGKVPKEIAELASDNIIIEGFVSDEALEKLYRECRISVVPLRFGAGVKGKVVEASYYQIPLITTSIGAEGLPLEDQSMLVEDDANKMAELVCGLYQDYEKLKIMSDNGKRFIENNFMLSEAERVIRLDIDVI